MKLKHLFFPVILLALMVTACSETKEENKYGNWRERNEEFIDSISNVYDSKLDPNLLAITDQKDKSQRVYYKIREAASSGEKPFLTSRVNVYYRGMILKDGGLDKLPVEGMLTSAYKNLTVFDGNIKGDNPDPTIDTTVEFQVNSLISGMTEVLQHMRPGDRWELYIPHQIGYGIYGNEAIPGYSVLMFDLTLESISSK